MPLNQIKTSETSKKRGYRKLKRFSVEKVAGGGHIVEHHYDSGDEMTYHEPERKVFGKTEGKQLGEHIDGLKGKLGINAADQSEQDGHDGKADEEY